MSQTFTPRYRAEVGSPTDQTAFCDSVMDRQGLAHYLLRGHRVATPQAARRGFHQTVQVVHLDGVVGETDPGRLEPLDPTWPRWGLRRLSLRHVVGNVQ